MSTQTNAPKTYNIKWVGERKRRYEALSKAEGLPMVNALDVAVNEALRKRGIKI